MDSKTRVTKSINFNQPDRYPIMFNILPKAWEKYSDSLYLLLKKYNKDLFKELENNELRLWRINSPTITSSAGIEKISAYILNDDFAFINPRSFMYGNPGIKGDQSDEWGCIWRRSDPSIIGIPIFSPLAKYFEKGSAIEGLKSYNFPHANSHWRYDYPFFREQSDFAEKYKKYLFAYIGNFFELLQYLVGYENLMIALYSEPKVIEELLVKIKYYNLETLKKLAVYNIQGICFEDDWGTQKDLMIDPKLWRRYFKPIYKDFVDEAKKRGLHVDFHSDGNIIKILNDLLEIGIDILNIQLSAMDIDMVSDICKGRVCIRTDIDRQYLLQFGTTNDVRTYVRNLIEKFGTKDGGLILYAEINYDSKIENVEELFRSFNEFGKIKL